MRPLLAFRPSPRRLLPALSLLLATASAACEREILREEARPSDARPRMAISTTPGGLAGMNEHGEIAITRNGRAYRWTRAGTLDLLPSPGNASATDINNFGLVLGNAVVNGSYVPVTWERGGGMRSLSGASDFGARAVNDAGTVVLSVGVDGYGTPYYPRRTYRWSAAGGQQLSAAWPGSGLPRYNVVDEVVVDINAAGAVLGTVRLWCEENWYDYQPPDCDTSFVETGAVVWKASGERVPLQWTGSRMAVYAHDLNDAGMVVGSSYDRSALWMPDGTVRIIVESGTARAINETGVVVGDYGLDEELRAYRWTESGGLEDLGTFGGDASQALDVNDRGDVTGWATTPDGVRHAFLWTPEHGLQMLAPATGETSSYGAIINNAREVAGISRVGGQNLPARWNDVVSDRPVANAGGPYTGRISGRRYAYTAVRSSDVDSPGLRYSWDMDGDGVFDGVTNAPLFGYTYPAGGTYTIRLEVRDERGNRDTATTTATIAQNVAPVVTVGGVPAAAGEGARIPLISSVSDANQSADTTELALMRYRWDWGDGYTSTSRHSTHAYADQGTYTVRLIVTDAGGLADTLESPIEIENVAPTGRLIVPTSIGEGAAFTVSATALADAPADRAAGLQVAFDCGGGFGAYGAATSIVCPAREDQGSVAVGMRVKDKDGAASEATRTIPVGNVAPRVTASATSPTTFQAGGSFSVSATFTDVAGDAPWRYRIYWGDGASTPLTSIAGGATITGSHAYAAPGTYTVQVAVADKDGGSGRSAPITVTVTP